MSEREFSNVSQYSRHDSGHESTPKRNRTALVVGAVVFLIASATGGYFYSRGQSEQAENLAEVTPQATVATTQEPEVQPVSEEMPTFATSYFAFRKAHLRNETKKNLSEAAKILVQRKDLKIRVAGYADEIGSKKYNQKLSEKRARNAAKYLIKEGVDASRITTIGFGENRPAVMGRDEASRKLNRRVVVDVIVPVNSVAKK